MLKIEYKKKKEDKEMKITGTKNLLSAAMAVAMITTFGIGCSTSNPAGPVNPATSGNLVIQSRESENRMNFLMTGVVERVDYGAQAIYLVKTDYAVVVAEGAKFYLMPDKRLIMLTEKTVHEGTELTVKGYTKESGERVAEVIEVRNEITTGGTVSNSR